jgi:hypothetical protein
MSDQPEIHTGGGASVGGDVQAARDFIGRDQFNITVHLDEMHEAAQVTQTIAAALDRDDLESASIRGSLLSLMEELRRTHSTLVKAISPLRRIKDDPETFTKDFQAVYFDFRDFYDTHDFYEERTHCHKIRQIHMRLEKHAAPITQTPEWAQLDQHLGILGEADLDVIERYYMPFMHRYDYVMVEIHQQLNMGEVAQAIALKQVFMEELADQYDGIKAMLRGMTDTIAEIEIALL